MEIAQNRDRDSDQDRIRESDGTPATAPTNLPAALPFDLKDYLSNPSQRYDQKSVQVHVMEKYAEFGMEKIRSALDFFRDYFQHSHDKFIRRTFPDRRKSSPRS